MARLKASRRRSQIVSVLFFALIALPAATRLVLPSDLAAIEHIENRAPSAWPARPQTLAEWNRAPRGIDAFLEDRFGLRSVLITVHQWLEEQFDLRIEFSGVIEGKDGWLFLADDELLERPSDADVAGWADAAVDFAGAVEDRGAVFAIMLAPRKSSVYGEFLPNYVPAPAGRSRLDRIAESAGERGLAAADAKSAIIAAKGRGRLYYRSDTHWTSIGAYHAYRALIATLQSEGVDAPMLERGRVEFPERDFSGDLARMLNRQERRAEQAPGVAVKNATPFRKESIDNFAFPPFDTEIITVDAAGRPTVLLIGDSFAAGLIPFLRESFSRIVFTHHHEGKFDRAVLDAYPSDVVILQMAEPMLAHELAPADNE